MVSVDRLDFKIPQLMLKEQPRGGGGLQSESVVLTSILMYILVSL